VSQCRGFANWVTLQSSSHDPAWEAITLVSALCCCCCCCCNSLSIHESADVTRCSFKMGLHSALCDLLLTEPCPIPKKSWSLVVYQKYSAQSERLWFQYSSIAAITFPFGGGAGGERLHINTTTTTTTGAFITRRMASQQGQKHSGYGHSPRRGGTPPHTQPSVNTTVLVVLYRTSHAFCDSWTHGRPPACNHWKDTISWICCNNPISVSIAWNDSTNSLTYNLCTFPPFQPENKKPL